GTTGYGTPVFGGGGGSSPPTFYPQHVSPFSQGDFSAHGGASAPSHTLSSPPPLAHPTLAPAPSSSSSTIFDSSILNETYHHEMQQLRKKYELEQHRIKAEEFLRQEQETVKQKILAVLKQE